jgi:transcription initiation factor TFIIIB Brf1 subunit/transcription initiation factor TFIIB
MLYFKSCPRCKTGTIEFTTDMWGKYLSCLMCGYAIHSKSIRPDSPVIAEAEVSMEAPSLVGAAVAAETGEDDELDDDSEFFDDLDESEADAPAARVAFG